MSGMSQQRQPRQSQTQQPETQQSQTQQPETQQPQTRQPQTRQPQVQGPPTQGSQIQRSPQGTGGGGGLRLSDVQGPQERQALATIQEAVAVCEWCADQCIQEANPEMVECIRLCEDVAELGESALTLVPRGSQFAPNVVSAFQQAASACAQECGRHSRAHCQECAEVLGRVVDSARTLLQGSQRGGTAQQAPTPQPGGTGTAGGQLSGQGIGGAGGSTGTIESSTGQSQF